MNEQEQAEFDRLKAENEALKTSVTENATQVAKFTADNAALKAQMDEFTANQKKAEFTAAKKAVESDLEALAKASAITPAQRDDLVTKCDKENLASVQFAVQTLKDANTKGGMDTSEQGRAGQERDNGMTAADRVDAEVAKLTLSADFGYAQAVRQVLAADPKLAREFADENDEEA